MYSSCQDRMIHPRVLKDLGKIISEFVEDKGGPRRQEKGKHSKMPGGKMPSLYTGKKKKKEQGNYRCSKLTLI